MNIIEIEKKHYILATSSLADQRTMVIKQGDTFAVFDHHGDIHQIGAGKQGIFHNGTRHLSKLSLLINGQRPLLLSAHPREDNQMLTIDLTNPDLPVNSSENTITQHGTIHVLRSKFLWQAAYHEKLSLTNFGLDTVDVLIEVQCDSDFADIFEVRGSIRAQRGTTLPMKTTLDSIQFCYQGLDNIKRGTHVQFFPAPAQIRENVGVFRITLSPHQEFNIEIQVTFEADAGHALRGFNASRHAMTDHIKKISNYCADIITSNGQFNEWISRSKYDLITMTTQTQYGLYPYAGVPWYSTPFGRDGIITAMETLWVEPELAKGVLLYLARTQANELNDFQDAEPGKILHETRGGEMAELAEIPFKLYYGTIDATPLFISLAGAYLERTNDLKTIGAIWPNIRMALDWIDKYGDIDGDGFVEYKTKSSKGLTNQGWKDSYDSIFYEDGQLAKDPIALCEVQGYVYDAKLSASRIATRLGFARLADQLKEQAQMLKDRFNEAFWSEKKQTYVIALDGNKNKCDVVSSNAGHCLFSGIATRGRASLIAKNLLDANMFSGWGIRTISSKESRYNPMSYHNGSVWPHENAMIALGLSRYNLMNETSQVMSSMFDTAGHMESSRLPELFCGFAREHEKFPTSYPVACSPQAWSVGAVFMMIQACLGLHIRAAEQKIVLCNPVLPSFVDDITVTNLRINGKAIAFQVRRTTQGVHAVPLNGTRDVTIEVVNESPNSDQRKTELSSAYAVT